MEIIIRGDKIKITDAMSDYINDKLGKLNKYLENSDTVRANVIVKVKNHEQRVEITIPLKTFITLYTNKKGTNQVPLMNYSDSITP